MPAWAIPLSIVVLGEKFNGRKLAGLALGMAALLLLLGDGLRTLGTAPLGSLLVVGASVSWALGTVLQKRYPVAMPAAAYTAWIMLLGGLPILLGALVFEGWPRMHAGVANARFWPIAGLLYNIFVAFAFAHWAWIKIATSVPVGVFSLSMLVIPVVGVISGMLFLGERPSWAEYVALVLVLASLFTVVLPARQSR
jgi:drug/metabolite transporter (DMT)-like permease